MTGAWDDPRPPPPEARRCASPCSPPWPPCSASCWPRPTSPGAEAEAGAEAGAEAEAEAGAEAEAEAEAEARGRFVATSRGVVRYNEVAHNCFNGLTGRKHAFKQKPMAGHR